MPKVMGYLAEENPVTRVLDNSEDSEFKHLEPGFTLMVDSVGSLSESD